MGASSKNYKKKKGSVNIKVIQKSNHEQVNIDTLQVMSLHGRKFSTDCTK